MYLDKPIPLRGRGTRNRRRGPGRSRGSGVIVVLALAAVNYFLFFHDVGDDESILPPQAIAVVALPDGDAPSADGQDQPRQLDDFGQPTGRELKGSLKRGQTVLRALRAEGIDSQGALPLIHAMEQVFDFRKAQVGDKFEAVVNDEGQVTHLSYTQSPLEVYEVVLAADGRYNAHKKKIPTRVDIAYIGCAVKSSLYESMTRCGADAQLAAKLVDVLAWDVDFFQDVRAGDEFKLIVEKVSVKNRFLKFGRVLAAEYKGKFGQHRIIAFDDGQGQGTTAYYKPDGRGAKKEFLKSPLKYTRVSARSQSVVRKALKGASPMIYTARAKTPVWAVSEGTVVFAGDSGSLGKAVTIKHPNGYTSTYGHLGRIARGVKVGSKVKQKTILGRVGQSGKASEPQLLFSLRRGGRLVNPRHVRYAEAEPVQQELREDFDIEVQQVIEDLEAMPVIGVLERKS